MTFIVVDIKEIKLQCLPSSNSLKQEVIGNLELFKQDGGNS